VAEEDVSPRLAKLVVAGMTTLVPVVARAQGDDAHRRPIPSLLWFGTQLVPSPGLVHGREGSAFDLRWQVTPLAYSLGLDRRVPRWRSFIVEPLARHAGSIELYATPEAIFGTKERLFVRPGVRAYLPLVEHGEALSVSVGTSYQRIAGVGAVAVEAGIYVLFGILGFQLAHAPAQTTPAQSSATLSVRYF
jgi:hypothetical protein